MQRGKFPAHSMHQDRIDLVGAAIGAGGAALAVEATTGTWGLAVRDNFFTTTGSSRTSQGLFVMAFKEMPPVILDIRVEVHTVAGTALIGHARTYSLTAKTVTIDIRDDAGAVQDPTANEHIRVTIFGRESTV